MSLRRRLLSVAAAVLILLPLSYAADAQGQPKPKIFNYSIPKAKTTDKKAAAMEYGPVIGCTLGVGPNNGIGNVAAKGLVIRLDKEKQAFVCFDTELLRYSAGWVGERFNMQGRSFANDSDTFSFVEGKPVFATPMQPGWANGDKRDDPRESPEGLLPASWGKWSGLFLHGERVVLSYWVGTTPVLETPGVQFNGDVPIFTRTIRVGPSDGKTALLAFEVPDGQAPARDASREDSVALAAGDEVTSAFVSGAPKGTVWEVDGSRVYLCVPMLAQPATFQIAIAKTAKGKPDPLGIIAGGPVKEDVLALTKGGPTRWTETITTKGTRATTAGPYVIDTIAQPDENPYKSWLRFTGMDFFPDGKSAALCTWNGDVWIVSGIDESLEKLTWKRFATGLNQPMGLKIVDGAIYTAARDQITKLHDVNADGEADFYENINNEVVLTHNFHEMVFDLQTDAAGNFYFTKGSAIWQGSLRRAKHNGTFLKMSKDGSKLEILATGLRAPNGVGVGPNGELTCSDNQGNWTPTSCINFIEPGKFYGFHHPGEKQEPRQPPLAWVPHFYDASPGTQLWVPDDRWGPLKGSMIETSYATHLLLVPYELFEKPIDGVRANGGCVKFPLKFPSGVMRGRFNPADGQLYVCGIRGWSSGAAADACFQRVRYTGKPVLMPKRVNTRKGGLDVTFTAPLSKDSADPENIGAEQFNYTRSGNYGSDERSANDPTKKGRDPVAIKSVKLSDDGKTLSLEIPDLKPVTNLLLKFNLESADGTAFTAEMSWTINRVP